MPTRTLAIYSSRRCRPRKAANAKLSESWQLTFVDFGMVGHVPENLRKGLRETVIAVGTRDAARLIKSYKELGFLLPGADTQALEQASAAVFDRFWGMSMSELKNVRPNEVHDIGHRVRDVMVETPFQVPNDLLMLVRTVAILSGMCTGLDPNFNLWEQLSPYASKLVQEEASSAFSVDNILKQVGGCCASFYCPAISSQPPARANGIGRVGGAVAAGDARSPHAGAFGGPPDRRGDIRRVSGQRGDVIK